MPDSTPFQNRIPLRFYALLFALALLILPWWGAEPISWTAIRAGGESPASLILFQQRIPRVLLALLVGGSLSMAGASLQVLFRNPLAEPWTLGVAGGAAVGAFIAQAVPGLQISWGLISGTQLLSLAGAAAVLGLIFSYARRTDAAPHTLLLAGVTISILSGSLIMLATYFISPFRFMAYHRWMMGGLDIIGYRDLASMLMLSFPGLMLLLFQARALNHLALGEETALGHGVDVGRVQRRTLLGAGLVTAACVTLAGPIGFVGLIVPHMLRRFSGYDHRIVLTGSFLLGGAVLGLCDGAARSLIAPTEIPVGVITAVIGGPVFLFLLGRR